jgi:hypothetical protein
MNKTLLSDFPVWYQILALVFLLNSLSFALIGGLHGGWYPEIIDGIPFVHDHSVYSRVSYGVYLYLHIQQIIIFILLIVVLLLGYWLKVKRKRLANEF